MRMHARVSRVDPAERSAPDLDCKRHVARTFERRAGKQRTAKSERRVDIELRGLQIRVELCRAIGGGKRIGKSSRHRPAIEFRLEAINSNSVAAKRNITVETQRSKIALSTLTPAFEPESQRSRIGRVDLCRSRKSGAVVADGEASAQPHLGQTRCAELEPIEAPPVCIATDIAAQVLHGVTTERHLIDANAKLDRQRRPKRACSERGEPVDRGCRRLLFGTAPG